MDKTSLGDRMKKYEGAFKYVLPPRMPVIIRVDGRAFHTLTRGLRQPFDIRLVAVMNKVATALCEEVQGAQLAYAQSDEISVLVHSYKKFASQGWFDNEVQKMASISAAVASSVFTANSWRIWVPERGDPDFDMKMHQDRAEFTRPAQFDSRVFVLPEAEVANYFIWRQQDFERNSVQMLARSLYSHRECNNKNNADLQEMCWEKGQNWNDLPTSLRRGRCVVRNDDRRWFVDEEVPQFKLDRDYIEQHLDTEEE
jgi:tRNA(His) 5'-end guanylyltransferase